MKKLTLTIAVVLGMAMGAFAQGGLFGLGQTREMQGTLDDPTRADPFLSLPTNHGDPNDSPAPLGSGVAVLIGFGAAYAMSKRRKK